MVKYTKKQKENKMGLKNLFRINILWDDDSKNTLVYKYPFKNGGREVNNKSTITVKESQVAVLVHKGQIADVLGPGLHDLNTDIIPLLTKLASWKYAFETPITFDVYFVNTKQFTDIKWGTLNPIMMRDKEFGVVRVRGFGAFSFRVDDPRIFLKELFGTNSTFKTEDITGWLKTMLLSAFADSLGESQISAIDLAANSLEFNEIVRRAIQNEFRELGLELTKFIIENMSVPEEVEKALDEKSKLGILGDSTDTLLKVSAAEAMKDAAKNPGGAFMGAGIGVGAGLGIGGVMANAFSSSDKKAEPEKKGGTKTCQKCGATVPSDAKFCSSCGEKLPTKRFCSNCGAEVDGNAKFCSSCGNKL